MRNRFEQQYEIGLKLISETRFPVKSRDEFPALVLALVELFNTPEYNDKIFNILSEKINKNIKKTGRPGMHLWQIFVLAQTRLVLNTNYDRLHAMANSDSIFRQLLGIERESGYEYEQFSMQSIKDNVSLLDEATLKSINIEIVSFGHKVFKKKAEEALSLKTDSFVVETNVHFPTDYNLLWDSARKSLDIIDLYKSKNKNTEDWRKSNDWRKSMKTLSRSLGKACSLTGKNKDNNVNIACKNYLDKSNALLLKLKKSITDFAYNDIKDLGLVISLEHFTNLLEKHIDLVDRRLIKGEQIPHQEKLFSIFETYTEWISKGKINKKVELGKLLSITTDQYNLIIDYYIHDKITDSEIVTEIADRIINTWKISTWSFDKGYWNKDNKKLLENEVGKVIMPKKGKPNKAETQEEHEPEFKKFRRKHSAVESNINELEHRGLDRCPDKSYNSFKRYVGIAVAGYNLHKIGKELLKLQLAKEKLIKVRAA
jgi:hypothetical protein